MDRLNERPAPAPGVTASIPTTPELPTPPAQIWDALTPAQQHAVFQTLIRVCRTRMTADHPSVEVSDEQC